MRHDGDCLADRDIHRARGGLVVCRVGRCESECVRCGAGVWCGGGVGPSESACHRSDAAVERRVGKPLSVGDEGGIGYVQDGGNSLLNREVQRLGSGKIGIRAGGGDAVVSRIGGCGGAGGVRSSIAAFVARGETEARRCTWQDRRDLGHGDA